MTKKLKNRLKLGIFIALALLIGGLSGAKASSGFSWANVERYVASLISEKVDNPIVEEELGAVTGSALPNPNCINNLCTWVVSGDFKDVSTTFVSVEDPFRQVTTTGGIVLEVAGGVGWTGASTSVDYVALHQTGANTSSYGVSCAPSTGAVATGQIVQSKAIVTTTVDGKSAIATSSLGILQNNMTAALGNRVAGGTVAKILMGNSDPYFVCLADLNADGPASMTNADNTFAGKFWIRFTRPTL